MTEFLSAANHVTNVPNSWREFLDERPGMAIFLRGYTAACREFCERLTDREGRKPAAIIDKNLSRQGAEYLGVPIVSPAEAAARGTGAAILFVKDDAVEAVRREMAEAGFPSGHIFSYRDVQARDVRTMNSRLAGRSPGENRVLLDSEMHQSAVVAALPSIVRLEGGRNCNLNCVMCEYYHKELKSAYIAEGKCAVTPESIDFLLSSAEAVTDVSGEPLMNPEFWNFLAFIGERHPGKTVSITTNGTLLNKANIERLLASPVRDVRISVDGASAKTYERLRDFSFDRLVANIGRLVEEKRKARRDDLSICITVVAMRENIKELSDIVLLAKRLGVDEVRVQPLVHRENAEIWNVPSHAEKTGDGFRFFYLQQMSEFYPNLFASCLEKAEAVAAGAGIPFSRTTLSSLPSSDYDIPYPLDAESFLVEADLFRRSLKPGGASGEEFGEKCGDPWRGCFIGSMGSMTVCCYLPCHILPNLRERPFEEIWNGTALRNIRQGIMRGRLNALCYDIKCPFALRERSAGGSRESALAFGQLVCFDWRGNNAREFLEYSGLGYPDSEGVWFTGDKARIAYTPTRKKAHRLSLRWRPYIDPETGRPQKAAVTIGCVRSEIVSRGNGFQDCHFDIPEAAFQNAVDEEGRIAIDFAFATPVDLGKFNPRDARRVSFQLARLSIGEIPLEHAADIS